MEQQLHEIREQQKAAWNRFSPGWKKWDNLTMDFLKPFGDEIIRQLDLKDTDCVLDIAAGTGEPGLTIASRLNRGRVMITDLADDMLAIAHEKSAMKGINNVEFMVCDACDLPFAENTFDGISCRMGFMFFPDMLLAAKELIRVLKPGGRLVVSVWNIPEKNFWVTAMMNTVNKYLGLPSPAYDSPGLFRCAKGGLMTDIFSQAGFKNISQKEIPGKLNCRTADVYWAFMTETPAPVAKAMSLANDTLKEKVKDEVYQTLNQKYPAGNVFIDSSGLIIIGEK